MSASDPRFQHPYESGPRHMPDDTVGIRHGKAMIATLVEGLSLSCDCEIYLYEKCLCRRPPPSGPHRP